jgi:3D (Asp-Asp-Asp) domain-containing protein
MMATGRRATKVPKSFGTVRRVRGRRESRPALVLAAAGAVVVAALPAGAGAGPSRQATVLRGQESSLASRSRNAVLGLYALDTRLARARAELAALHARSAEVQRERARVAHEISVARGVLVESQRQLGTRLRTLYEQGEPDAIAVLLGATSLEDAVSRLDALERSAHLNRDAIDQSSSAAKLASRAAELRILEANAAQTAAALAADRAERIRYIASLRAEQRLRVRQIARLDETARSGAQRSQAIAFEQTAATATTAPTVPTASPAAAGTLTVTATGYSLVGATATGLPVGWGVVAVDPAVIPLGTRMTIPGYGEGVAADTGGAVQGATIDLWFLTDAQALAWGRRLVTITLH